MKSTLTKHGKLLAWVAVAAAMLAAAFALAAYAIGHAAADQRHTNRQICLAFNRFDLVITQTLQRSLVTLPTLAYFRQHPAELAAQRAEIRRELTLFRPRRC